VLHPARRRTTSSIPVPNVSAAAANTSVTVGDDPVDGNVRGTGAA
jgi:hypothetical protein